MGEVASAAGRCGALAEVAPTVFFQSHRHRSTRWESGSTAVIAVRLSQDDSYILHKRLIPVIIRMRQLIRAFPLHTPCGEVIPMSDYEILSLMISFGMLVAFIMSSNKK